MNLVGTMYRLSVATMRYDRRVNVDSKAEYTA